MASARGHKRGVSGFLGNLFRGLFSGDSLGRVESGNRRRGAKPRLLRFEGCEQRQLLSVTTGWDSTTGTLTITGDAADNKVSVFGYSSYVDVYVAGRYQARFTNANSGNVHTINFNGDAGNDALTVQNIQPSGALTIGATAADFANVESLSLLKCQNVTVNTNGGFSFGNSTIAGTLAVNAAGNLTQSGPVVVGGAATLAVGNANDITLTQAKNNFYSVAVTTGNNVSLVDVNSLVLGASTVSGNLNVQASIKSSSRGTLSQSGVLDVDGNTTLAVGRASTIALTSNNVLGDNPATDIVSIASAGNATLKNTVRTTLGTSYVTGNLVLTVDVTADPGANPVLAQAAGASLVVGKIATLSATYTHDPGSGPVSDPANVTLGNSVNNFGTVVVADGKDVSLRDVNAIVLGASAADGALTVIAGGQISQKGALSVAGDAAFNAGSNNIVLKTAANAFGGAVAVAGRNVTLRADGGLDLGASTVSGNLDVVVTGGDLTDSGQVSVTGKATVKAESVELDGIDDIGGGIAGGDKFNQLAVTTTDVGGSNAIKDVGGGIVFAKSSIKGDLEVESTGGAITQNDSIVVSGVATFTADNNPGGSPTHWYDVTLANAKNNFGTVHVLSAKSVSLADTNSIVLGNLTLDDTDGPANLVVTARSSVTQNAGDAADVPGTTTIVAGRSSSIALAGTGNTFAGAVSLSARDVTFTNSSDTVFDTVTAAGNLTVVSGEITQKTGGGAMVVGRTAGFTTSGGDVTLDNAHNDFFVVGFSGTGAVTLTDANAVALGTSTIGGDLLVTAGKSISQTGGLTVGDFHATFIAGPTSKDTIVLNNSNNAFNAAGDEAVSLTAGGNVALANSVALNLGNASVGGALSVTTSDDAITQATGTALEIDGKTTLAAGTANITLGNADNDFIGEVAVTSAGSVILGDSNELILGKCSITANLTVGAGGDLTQSDAVVAAGTVSLDATGFNITLDDDGNDFGTLLLKGDMVTIVDKNALALGASTITGDFELTTSGAVSEGAGALTVLGTTTLDAGAGNDISLGTLAHDFNKVFVASGYNVALRDASAAGLILGTSDVTGALTVTAAAGGISQEGSLAVNLTLTLTAAGNITLNDLDNFFFTVVASGVEVTLFNNADIDLGGVSATNLVVDAVGQISDSAATLVTGTSSFTARTADNKSDDIFLDASGANYGTSLSLDGRDVVVENDTMATLTIGNATVTGDLMVTLNAATPQTFTNAPGSNMSVDGKTTLTNSTTGGVINLYTVGCKFHDWAFGDPSDDLYDPSADPHDNDNLSIEAETINVY